MDERDLRRLRFAEDEARALFRSQEVEKLNKEMLQVALAISEQEIGSCRVTAEAAPSPTTSDERTKVPEDQRNAIDPFRLVDPWSKTTDGKDIKTCAVDFDKGTLPESTSTAALPAVAVWWRSICLFQVSILENLQQ